MAEEKIRLRGTPEEIAARIPELLDLYQIIKTRDVGIIYAYSNDLESVKRIGKPKVTLFFLEDTNFKPTGTSNKIPEGRRRTEGVIRFRLMDESTQSFTKANGTMLGRKIKEVFGANGGFVWNKGKTLYNYNDWERGYQFQLLCRNKTEAKRIITSTMSLQNHTPDWKRLFTSENDQEIAVYPENPGTHVVMGETLPLPRSRPLVDVRFQYAYVQLDGVKEPFNLYDRTKKKVNPLVV